jgi:two-component system cell cycle sensor histidine kinase/response regulator CckA
MEKNKNGAVMSKGVFANLLMHYSFSLKKMRRLPQWLKNAQSYMKDANTFQKNLKPSYFFNRSPAANIILDAQGGIQDYNETFSERFLIQPELCSEHPFLSLLSDSCQEELNYDFVMALKQHKGDVPLELEFKTGQFALAYFSVLEFCDIDTAQIYRGYFLQVFDNSEHKQQQQRLAQSQKLQALGQLAGGIAHDFNNLLTAMIGYCDLLLLRHSPSDQSFTEIMQVKQNANRATNLVRQLLAFSRQQTLIPSILDVSEVLFELTQLLQRLIGPVIELKITHGRDLYNIKADRGQFEQLITNLVVNAREAIQGAGMIHIVSSNRSFSEPVLISNETIKPGHYLQIEVADTGCGIDPKNLSRIFDPFFSTKESSSNTGFGLSTVYGIVKQAEGYIIAESTLNVGTRFTLLLPQTGSEEKIVPRSVAEPQGLYGFRDLTGKGRVLLAEDEDAVRSFASRALSAKGYTVIEANDGQEALAYLQNVKSNFEVPQLLITDVMMPKVDGVSLVKEALKLYPYLKVIYISGYAEEAFRDQVSRDAQARFLTKPFSLKSLANIVREVFDEIERSR